MPATEPRFRHIAQHPVVRSVARCLVICAVEATFRPAQRASEPTCGSKSCH
ncbi:MAG TPA: hypothetical protein VJ777_21545 [Mycobacterium sp.]|nr:hypothetical protein [Mycobacterium sp.]